VRRSPRWLLGSPRFACRDGLAMLGMTPTW